MQKYISRIIQVMNSLHVTFDISVKPTNDQYSMLVSYQQLKPIFLVTKSSLLLRERLAQQFSLFDDNLNTLRLPILP